MGASVTWTAFADEAAFCAWHDQACADNGIPHPGSNLASGLVDTAAQWTTAYVDPWIDHAAGDVIKANLPDADLERYGLKPTEPPSWEPSDLHQPPEHPTWDWHQPVPDTERAR